MGANANTNDCGVGARRCNSQCAHVFLLFYNRCFADMSALVHEQVSPSSNLCMPAHSSSRESSTRTAILCVGENHYERTIELATCVPFMRR